MITVYKLSSVKQSISIYRMLHITVASSATLGIVTGALVLLAIPVRDNLVFGLGLVSIGLLFITGLIILSLAFIVSR